MTSKICSDLGTVHPYVKQRALAVLKDCKAKGLTVEVFETSRTLQRQKWLKANGKSKTLNSYHRLGLAVDFVFKTKKGNWTWRVADAKWDELAVILETNGFSSLWKRSGWDGPHGEVRFKGVNTRTLYKELKDLNNDLSEFWEACINPRLRVYCDWPTEFKITPPAPVKAELLEALKFEGIEVRDKREETEEPQSEGFWAWIKSLFGGKV